MAGDEAISRQAFPSAGGFLITAVCFAAAYAQAPLYYSNQNQYFLHGLAQAGVGLLQEDWLANTRDPTPLFSGLVAFTARYLHPWLFYLFYALVLALYAAAMLGLFFLIVGTARARQRWPIFAALLILVHSALFRLISYRLAGHDYPWYLQAGLAGQYVLGPVLQPSVFGVVLVVSIAVFLLDRPFLAAAIAVLAGTLHFTYLLPAGLVVCGFCAALLIEGRVGRAVGIGALSLGLALPTAIYVSLTFRPISAESFAEANNLLVNFRIPHHCRPDLFMDGMAYVQLGWLLLGIALAPTRRFLVVLVIPALLGLLLTLVQVLTGNNNLAVLFPWRISAVLLPITTTIVLSRLSAGLPRSMESRAGRVMAFVCIVALGGAGLWISVARMGFQTNNAEAPLLEFARLSRKPGDCYLLPVELPDRTGKPHGSESGDFKPLVVKKRDGGFIPMDLQGFRLATGAPIFVDFKAIPYRDSEVLKWYRRLRLNQELDAMIREGKLAAALWQMRRLGITHFVVTAGHELQDPRIELVHGDGNYRVYRLTDR